MYSVENYLGKATDIYKEKMDGLETLNRFYIHNLASIIGSESLLIEYFNFSEFDKTNELIVKHEELVNRYLDSKLRWFEKTEIDDLIVKSTFMTKDGKRIPFKLALSEIVLMIFILKEVNGNNNVFLENNLLGEFNEELLKISNIGEVVQKKIAKEIENNISSMAELPDENPKGISTQEALKLDEINSLSDLSKALDRNSKAISTKLDALEHAGIPHAPGYNNIGASLILHYELLLCYLRSKSEIHPIILSMSSNIFDMHFFEV